MSQPGNHDRFSVPDPALRALYAREKDLLERLQQSNDPHVRAELGEIQRQIRQKLRGEDEQ